jgi:hypothetical protein
MAKKLPLNHPELQWLYTAPVFHPAAEGEEELTPKISDQFPQRYGSYVGFGALKYGDPSKGELLEQEKTGGLRFGSFSRAQLKELLPALVATWKGEGIYAYYEAGPREIGVAVANRESAFYRTSLEAMHGLCFRGEHHSTPTYWWPADRGWMIYSDPDSPFAVFASHPGLAEEVMDRVDFVFERFTADTRYELGMFDNPRSTR